MSTRLPTPEEARILDLVIADLHARDAKGRETYGASLRAGSPNDALRSLYEEILDSAQYIRQEIERRSQSAGIDLDAIRNAAVAAGPRGAVVPALDNWQWRDFPASCLRDNAADVVLLLLARIDALRAELRGAS